MCWTQCCSDVGACVVIFKFCFVLFALQFSVCLWWHDCRRDDFPTLKVVVVMAVRCMREEPFALSATPTKNMVQGYPRFKNLSSGGKSLELCVDVASDVGIKAKSRLLRFS